MDREPDVGSVSNQASTPRSGRHGTRSKTGCSTCRTRKVKCDEMRPQCKRCEKAQITCEWDRPVVRRPVTHKNQYLSPAHESPNTIDSHLSPCVLHPSSQQSPVNENSETSAGLLPTVTTSPAAAAIDLTNAQGSHSPQHNYENPLLLNQDDPQSLEFLARSPMVLRFGKPWRWSMLFYVCSRVASREQGVSRAFIAVVSMERRCHELAEAQNPGSSTNSLREAQKFKDKASEALHSAILDLSELLSRLGTHPNNHDDLEAVFAMWFLILHFGIYDVDLVHTSYMHLNGIRAFLEDWFHGSAERRIHKLPLAAKQLLMFICYMDVTLALGGQGDGKLSTFLVDEPTDSPVSFDRLFEETRVCVPQLWGSEYPTEELLDDIENYRPLKLLFLCQVIKLRTWQNGTAGLHSQYTSKSGNLWEAIEELEQAYQDVLLLAKSIQRTDGRRVIWTVYHAYLDFCGLKILFCCLPDTECRPSWLSGVLSDLLKVAHKALVEDPRHVYRYAWPLRMALFRLTDPIHREWVQTQTAKASLLLSNLGIPANVPESGASDDTLFVSHPLSANNSPTQNFHNT